MTSQRVAFTTSYNTIAKAIITPAGIRQNATQSKGIETIGIWDTGASNSVITQYVIDTLELQPSGIVYVKHAGGQSKSEQYFVDIILPNNIVVHTSANRGHIDDTRKDIGLLIGMDIIGLGDMAITNTDGKTVFSFRIPSLKRIDFVPETDTYNILSRGNRKQRRALKKKK